MKLENNHFDVAIVGGGLTGLAAANLLHEAGRNVHIFEGAPEVGGRIRSFRDPVHGHTLGDRGPIWVWPEFQPVIASWIDRLELELFERFADGESILEVSPHQAPKPAFMPSLYGSMQLKGGTARLSGNSLADSHVTQSRQTCG